LTAAKQLPRHGLSLELLVRTGGGRAAHDTDYGGYSGYFADPDGHVWEVAAAPGIDVQEVGRVSLPE
jgi:hypothetical protein